MVNGWQRNNNRRGGVEFFPDFPHNTLRRLLTRGNFAAGELPAMLKAISVASPTDEDLASFDNDSDGDINSGHISVHSHQ